MAVIYDRVGHTLPHQMRTDGEAFQAVFCQDVLTTFDVTVIRQGFVHFKVVAPAGQFQAIVSPAFGLCCQGVQCQIRPLAGK